jgi:hypothetical protein
MRFNTAVLALLIACVGCSVVEQPKQVRRLPAPKMEAPPANVPPQLRQRNWPSRERESYGQGSCVHASLTTHLRWLNEFELGEDWRGKFSGGEYETRLRQRLDANSIDYAYTNRSDPRFLDWASATRRGCIIWWKPSHCCFFAGFVSNPAGKPPGEYAVVIDNNYPERLEYTEREQFIRLWAGYGGFGLTILLPPATSFTWKSYEEVQ